MKLAVIPVDKTLVIDDWGISPCLHVDLSWIPSDVWAFHWDSETNTGEIEYTDGRVNEEVTELGIFAQAVTDFEDEKRLQEEAYEASRDLWKELRGLRNSRLAASDWTQSRDIQLSNNEEWVKYRQELRDFPEGVIDPKIYADNPDEPGWPQKPS
tara:strand:- start:1365 stop:1829 length:465 start_codon:yes stop_codon:yes gene_type:complete